MNYSPVSNARSGVIEITYYKKSLTGILNQLGATAHHSVTLSALINLKNVPNYLKTAIKLQNADRF